MTTRHCYNQTNDAWYIAITGASLPDLFGVTQGDGFIYANIPPNSTCTIEYTNTQPGEGQALGGNITFQQPGRPAGSWAWTPGVVPFPDITIEHDGDTDGLNLNEPAGGDVTLFGS
jgi:hypothetical protein